MLPFFLLVFCLVLDVDCADGALSVAIVPLMRTIVFDAWDAVNTLRSIAIRARYRTRLPSGTCLVAQEMKKKEVGSTCPRAR